MFLKPNPERIVEGTSLQVFDPEHMDWMPSEGRHVPSSPYWVRRVAEGDCVYVVDAEADEAPAEAEAVKAPAPSLNKKELQDLLDTMGVEFPASATKAELIALVEKATAEKKGE